MLIKSHFLLNRWILLKYFMREIISFFIYKSRISSLICSRYYASYLSEEWRYMNPLYWAPALYAKVSRGSLSRGQTQRTLPSLSSELPEAPGKSETESTLILRWIYYLHALGNYIPLRRLHVTVQYLLYKLCFLTLTGPLAQLGKKVRIPLSIDQNKCIFIHLISLGSQLLSEMAHSKIKMLRKSVSHVHRSVFDSLLCVS